LTICWLCVLGLELRIRLAGGSGALIATTTSHQTLARRLLGVHIVGAVLTYVIWTGLAIASTRRFRSTLPGTFSRRHRQLGWCVFAGLVFTAATASGMYILTCGPG
jgi:putative membrane protein